MEKSSRKKPTMLTFDASSNTVRTVGGTVLINLDNLDEPTRAAGLKLTADNAVRLAAKIAHQLGYKLVEVEK